MTNPTIEATLNYQENCDYKQSSTTRVCFDFTGYAEKTWKQMSGDAFEFAAGLADWAVWQ